MQVLFAVYPTLCTYILQIFKCTDVEGTNYLDADLTLACEGEEYELMFQLGGLFFVLYSLGIPAMFAIALFRSRPLLEAAAAEAKRQEEEGEDDKIDVNSPANKVSVLSLGWLAIAYEKEFWFW